MDNDIKYNHEVLRAEDIIPASEQQLQQGKNTHCIPRFDLATEIMAQQRKLTSSRRKKPASRTLPPNVESQAKLPAASTAAFASRMSANDTIIAEIVRRDIQGMLLA